MKILVTGATGQLGTELCHLLDENHIEYVGTGSKQLDITDKNAVNLYFEEYRPDFVYHCAAYTSVDAAEEEPGKDINYKVNVIGTRNIAEASEKCNATMVYISTDYVFDGSNTGLYTEKSETNPQNEYGRSKLNGERIVEKTMSKYYIIRTSWIFGKYGKNFVYTMLDLSENHQYLNVVNDQLGRPTWTRTLSEFMIYLVDERASYGLYQLSNESTCTWYEFAKEIFKDKNIEIHPISSNDYPQKAFRPRNSVMDLSKVKKTGFKIISWQDALQNFMASIDS